MLGFGLCQFLKAGRAGALSVPGYLHMHIKYERNTENKQSMFDCSV